MLQYQNSSLVVPPISYWVESHTVVKSMHQNPNQRCHHGKEGAEHSAQSPESAARQRGCWWHWHCTWENQTPVPCGWHSSPATALNYLQPKQSFPRQTQGCGGSESKGFHPLFQPGRENGPSMQVVYEALLKSQPTNPGKAHKSNTYKELNPFTLFSTLSFASTFLV